MCIVADALQWRSYITGIFSTVDTVSPFCHFYLVTLPFIEFCVCRLCYLRNITKMFASMLRRFSSGLIMKTFTHLYNHYIGNHNRVCCIS